MMLMLPVEYGAQVNSLTFSNVHSPNDWSYSKPNRVLELSLSMT